MIGRGSNRHRGLPAMGASASLRGDLLMLAVAGSLSVHLAMLALNPDRMSLGDGERVTHPSVAIRFASAPAARPALPAPDPVMPVPPPSLQAPSIQSDTPVKADPEPIALIPESIPIFETPPDIEPAPVTEPTSFIQEVAAIPAPPRPQAKPAEPVREQVQIATPAAVTPVELLSEPASDLAATPSPAGPATETVQQIADTAPTAMPATIDPILITDPTFRTPPEPPRYPPISRKRDEEGVVVLRAAVSPGGRTLSVEVWQSSGFYRLDDAALDAARRWQFEPAQHAGLPVESLVEVPVRFHLN